ncbi:hypothetical protein BKG78_19580 [Mycobacteroides chelonae]|nr:hypothetical protein BKG78_19580 [Mycobacteroides chelonae]
MVAASTGIIVMIAFGAVALVGMRLLVAMSVSAILIAKLAARPDADTEGQRQDGHDGGHCSRNGQRSGQQSPLSLFGCLRRRGYAYSRHRLANSGVQVFGWFGLLVRIVNVGHDSTMPMWR